MFSNGSPGRCRLFWLILLIACLPLTMSSAIVVTTDTLHTEPRPATISGKTDAGDPAKWRVVGCIRRMRGTAEMKDDPPDVKSFSYVNHVSSDCDRQTLQEHKAGIRLVVTEGLEEAGTQLSLYWDLRVYEDGFYKGGRTEQEAVGTDHIFYSTSTVIEVDWYQPTELSTGINQVVTYEAGTWQGGTDQWKRSASVAM